MEQDGVGTVCLREEGAIYLLKIGILNGSQCKLLLQALSCKNCYGTQVALLFTSTSDDCYTG